MSSEPQTPTVTVTDELEDVTEKDRSPAENAFYESFLLQSRSAIESLYASNIYHSQKHAKQVRDLERQKQYSMFEMSNKQKEMLKKMAQLQGKQEQIMEDKRKQRLNLLSARNDQRIRPHSTPSPANRMLSPMVRNRPRSGSMPYLEPLDPGFLSNSLAKSSENLSRDSTSLLSANLSPSPMSRSCEDLTSIGKKNKVVLPALLIEKSPSTIEDLSADSDSTFITRMPSSSSTKPKVNFHLTMSNFKPERRRGSLDPCLARELDKRHGAGESAVDSPQTSPRSTQTKWIPKSFCLPQGRSLPPI